MGHLGLEADLAEKETGGLWEVQAELRSPEVVAEGDQNDHEVEEEALKTPNCCWKATVKRPKMCD